MNTQTDDGGAAFPLAENEYHTFQRGITLRDLFALKAMEGILSGPLATPSPEKLAQNSFAVADAMLAARNKAKDV